MLASWLGLIPILVGLASTFNIGLSESLKEELIRIAIIYSGFILSFMGGCTFYVSSLDRERVFLLWFLLCRGLQKIRTDRMLGVRLGRIGAFLYGLQSHLGHQAAHTVATD